MATRTAKKTTKAKAAPVEEPEEVLEDEEFDEVEEGEVEEAPAKKKKGNGRPSVDFGIASVCALLKEQTGKDVTPRELRTLARRLARDESKRIDREIVAGNRTMYSWAGPNDPEVKALIAAFKGGEGEIEKKAKLDALKASRADKPKAPKTAAKKKAKAQEPEVLEDDDEELDFDEDDE